MQIPPMTAALTCIIQRLLPSLLLVVGFAACGIHGEPEMRTTLAPAGTRAVNQLAVSGNACGPAALLNSLKFADSPWNGSLESFEGVSDRDALRLLIRRHGMRPSPHLGGRPRWSRRGINLADLTDIGNELVTPYGAGGVRYELLMAPSAENPGRLLARTHRCMERSLRNGIPPILSVRRFAQREGTWGVIDAHFITITGVPKRIPRNAESFAIQYIDPWGAVHREGRIESPHEGSAGFPVAVLPMADIGKKRLRDGAPTFLAASAVIGRF